MKPVIEIRDAGKKYNVYKRPTDRLKEMACLGRLHRHQELWALRGVSLSVTPGETLGFVGSNGAGKSTLLKLITGISRPSEGDITVRGRISALMELGAGFHTEFTGRENIYMNCSILGMSRKEIDERLDDIIAFSELGEFIDRPIRIYSTGMFMRLGFSVAVFTEPDILIIDEILAVGDEYFQSKCFRKIREFRDKGKTILFVSHSINSVRGLCRRALWLDGGRVVADGDSVDVTNRYLNFQRRRIGERMILDGAAVEYLREDLPGPGETETAEAPGPGAPAPGAAAEPPAEAPRDTRSEPLPEPQPAPEAAPSLSTSGTERASERAEGRPVPCPRTGTREGEIWKVEFLDAEGKVRTAFEHGEPLVVRLHFRSNGRVPNPNMGVSIWRNDGILAYGTSSAKDGASLPELPPEGYLDFILDDCTLMSGEYEVSVAIFCPDDIHPYDFHDRLYPLQVMASRRDEGVLWTPHRYRYVLDRGRRVIEHVAGRHPVPAMTNTATAASGRLETEAGEP
ncbi:MAG: ABC transporter ATP-binding protein [Acidobacteria bacterium]|nr:ABC transporter ATP-binding protein [Acidobacteriota bacterium]